MILFDQNLVKNNEIMSTDKTTEVGSSILLQQLWNILSILSYSLIVRKINFGVIDQTDTKGQRKKIYKLAKVFLDLYENCRKPRKIVQYLFRDSNQIS